MGSAKAPWDQHTRTMRKPLIIAIMLGTAAAANAQFQVNPQMGVNFQRITDARPGVEYKAAVGWQLGADLRFGDRFYVQPGAFFGRSATVERLALSDTLRIEDDLVRTNLRLAPSSATASSTPPVRPALRHGPSYDVLLSVDDRNDRIGYAAGDFRRGQMNTDAALGFDMGLVTGAQRELLWLSRCSRTTRRSATLARATLPTASRSASTSATTTKCLEGLQIKGKPPLSGGFPAGRPHACGPKPGGWHRPGVYGPRRGHCPGT